MEDQTVDPVADGADVVETPVSETEVTEAPAEEAEEKTVEETKTD